MKGRRVYFALALACGLLVGPLMPLPHGGGSALGFVLIVPLAFIGGLALLGATDGLEEAMHLGFRTSAVFAFGWLIALAARGLILPTPFSAFVVGLVGASMIVATPVILLGVVSGWGAHFVPRFARWLSK